MRVGHGPATRRPCYVACQKSGGKVGTTTVWNRLTDHHWVTDYYVSNQSNTSWSLPVPRCP